VDLFYDLSNHYRRLTFPRGVLSRISDIANNYDDIGQPYTGKLRRVGETTLQRKRDNLPLLTHVYRFDLPSQQPGHQFYFLFPHDTHELAGYWHRQWRREANGFVSQFMDTTIPYLQNTPNKTTANSVLKGGGTRLHEIRFEAELLENSHGFNTLQSTQSTATYRGADQFHTAHGFRPRLKDTLPLRERHLHLFERREGLGTDARELDESSTRRKWQEVDWTNTSHRGTKMAEITRLLDPERGPILFDVRQRLRHADEEKRLILD